MVFDQPKCVAGSKVKNCRIAIGENVLRFAQGGLQQSLIADAMSAAMLIDRNLMQLQHGSPGHPFRLVHLASSCRVLW